MSTGHTAYPAATTAAYRRQGWWRGRTLGSMLRETARRDGAATAVVSGSTRWTYDELDARCDRLASGFRGLGVRAGDRVVVQLPNVAEFPAVLFALMRLGAVPVLVMPTYRLQELRALMAVAEPVAYVVADVCAGFDHREAAVQLLAEVPSLREVVVVGDPGRFVALGALEVSGDGLAVPGDVDPEGIAVCVMSGGTTGAPKLVPRTHENYAYLPDVCAVAGVDRHEVHLAALPLAHNFPLSCPGLLGAVATGGAVVMAPTSSPDDVFALVERERVTWTTVVPTLVDLWAEAAAWAGRDLSSLRTIQVGGAVFRPERARRAAQALDCGIQQVYGMAEGLLTMTALDDPPERVATTQGTPPCAGDEIRLVDPDGVDVAPGAVGELWTRGPYTIRGYLGAPEAGDSFTADGFYRTGDLARRLPSGHLVIEGRAKDVVNRGGDKVPCEELEGQLLAHPAIRAAAVVGVPDPVLGERVCAWVVAAEGAELPSLRTLRGFLQDRGVASFKFPERLEPIDRLPLTKIGKIDRRSLSARAAGEG